MSDNKQSKELKKKTSKKGNNSNTENSKKTENISTGKSFLYTRAAKYILMAVNIFAIAALALTCYIMIAKNLYFNDDDITKIDNYWETTISKNQINSSVLSVMAYKEESEEYAFFDDSKPQMYTINYDSWDKRGISIKEFEKETNRLLLETAEYMFDNNRYYTDNNFAVSAYGFYNYAYFDFRGVKQYLRLSNSKYNDLITKYTVMNTQTFDELPEGVYVSGEEPTTEESTTEVETEPDEDTEDDLQEVIGIAETAYEISIGTDDGSAYGSENGDTSEEGDLEPGDNLDGESDNSDESDTASESDSTDNVSQDDGSQSEDEKNKTDNSYIFDDNDDSKYSNDEYMPIYNSYSVLENSRAFVKRIEDEEGNTSYQATINVNYSDDCYIMQWEGRTFLYSLSENVIYNDETGWLNYEDQMNHSDYFYIPVDYLDFTSETSLELSILTAPIFNSIVPCFFASIPDDYYESLSNAVFSKYNTGFEKSAFYVYRYKDAKGHEIVRTNAEDVMDVDVESYDDCVNEIKNYCDILIEYTGNDKKLGCVYENAVGVQEQVNCLNKTTIKKLEELDDNTDIFIGINVNKTENTSENYWRSVVFNLCKKVNHILPIYCIAIIVIIISMILLTINAGVVIKEDGTREVVRSTYDYMPIEVDLILLGMVGLVPVILNLGIKMFDLGFNSGKNDISYAIIYGAVVYFFVAMFVFLETYLSIVKRVKAKALWDELLAVRLFKYVMKFFRTLNFKGRDGLAIFLKYFVAFLVNSFCIVVIIVAYQMEITSTLRDFICKPTILLLVIFDIVFMLKDMRYANSVNHILKDTKRISSGEFDAKVDKSHLSENCKELADSINSIGDGLASAVEISTRDERMKAELITNVSHDIKTPLTSIINYVDLIKRENVDNKNVNNYIKILDQKSQRLKQLIEDLVEASKASTGNLTLECMNLNLVELLQQTQGDFYDKFCSRNLTLVPEIPEKPVIIYADGRRSFRIIENLFQNAFKYAMTGTRIYLKIEEKDGFACMTIKNVSEAPLNISPEELTERFVRGDASRTTEGSGLGLSIAKDLAVLQGGEFVISIDGDLFSVYVTFPLAPAEPLGADDTSDTDANEMN